MLLVGQGISYGPVVYSGDWDSGNGYVPAVPRTARNAPTTEEKTDD
jgi:hypothetical protein